ncbi:MAG: SGNH/GDSL hydrolase family protein [Verrucomicrobia bacterium]|nr:SGNH/GDSL hydrolase family protein [Verrucomicrobiota bacterium]
MSRAKRLVFWAAMLTLSNAFALLALELSLRWLQARATRALLAEQSKAVVIRSEIPGLHYTLRPGATNRNYSYNSLGFNMPERPARKPPGIWRIAAVGDSFTEGYGADSSADAFPNKLEKLLRERFRRQDIEVWNCGTGGYNVDQVFLTLSCIVTNYSPDAVIYGFCFNDYWGPNLYLEGQAGQPAGAEALAEARIGILDRIKALRTVMLVKNLYDSIHYRVNGYLPVFVDRKIGYPSWQAMKLRITEMRDFCRARGWPFAVCLLPFPQFLYVKDARNLALKDLRANLEREGIPFVDTTPILREHRSEKLFMDLDNHPNSRGYELIAEGLAEWMTTNRSAFLPEGERRSGVETPEDAR